jgi:hypothetical protein
MDFGAVEFAARGRGVHGMTGKPCGVILIQELRRHQAGEPATAVQKTDLILHG